MSAQLDQLLDGERLADCLRNDLAMGAEKAAEEITRRQRALSEVRAAIRKEGVRGPYELLAMLQNLHSSIRSPLVGTTEHEFAGRLLDLIADLDSELHDPDPTLDDIPGGY